MDPIRLALVGCGGMGTRHTYGIKELRDQGYGSVRLQAVCDVSERHASDVAGLAEELLGQRPRAYTSFDEMLDKEGDLEAIDITTSTRVHHVLACAAFERGLHVLVEKPIALTVRAANLMIEAAQRHGCVLSVAENYRRDPMNRLVQALIRDGAIGQPTMMIEAGVGGGDRIVITPWRHVRSQGCAILDVHVHHADIMRFYLGPIEELYAGAAMFEKVRHRRDQPTPTSPFYEKSNRGMPETVTCDVQDTAFSVVKFTSGALGQWTISFAGHGHGFGARLVYGSKGSLEPPGDRNGRPINLYLDEREGPISDEGLFDLAPSYELDGVTARLFGGQRLASYRLGFPEIDRKITAIELHELALAIREGQPVEVDGIEGRRALAAIMAIFESATTGAPVKLAEVEAGKVSAYQQEIDADLGIA